MKITGFILFYFVFGIEFLFAQQPFHFDLDYSVEEWQKIDSGEVWKSYHNLIDGSIQKKVVSINNGQCSGALISDKGLVISNYHCFFDEISILNKEFLENGFLANSLSAEIPLKGLEIEIIDTTYEITDQIIKNRKQESKKTAEKIDSVLNTFQEIKNERYIIKKFTPEERYYLLRYQIYNSITLVCIPPLNAANFGGQTENWVWPRYSSDFAILRINDQQKEFPYFSLNETINEFDNVFAIGFPSTTSRSSSSSAIHYKTDFENRIRTSIREKKLFILAEEMEKREKANELYFAKYQEISNYNIFLKSESQLVKDNKFLSNRQVKEQELANRDKEFKSVLDSLDLYYEKLKLYSIARLYLNEALVAPDIFLFSFKFNALNQMLKSNESSEKINQTVSKLIETTKSHFSGTDLNLDQKMFLKMLETYDEFVPDSLKPLNILNIKNNDDFDLYNYTKKIYQQSIFTSEFKTLQFLENPLSEFLEGDPIFQYTTGIIEHYFTQIAPKVNYFQNKVDYFSDTYSEKINILKSEANGTLRISAGKIEGYSPNESIHYSYKTTFEGWKIDNTQVSDKYLKDQFRQILKKNPETILCFVSSIDACSGNSGSPLLNSNGEMVGLVFDQNPEGMANQFFYEPSIQRASSLSVCAISKILNTYFNADNLMGEISFITD